jgi:hypothetical protein
MSPLRIAFLSLAFIGATFVFGWWGVPLLGLTWGIVGRSTVRPALTAGSAAGLAWALILGWSATVGPVGALAGKLGGITSTSGAVFVGLTLLLPMALASLAARVVRV